MFPGFSDGGRGGLVVVVVLDVPEMRERGDTDTGGRCIFVVLVDSRHLVWSQRISFTFVYA